MTSYESFRQVPDFPRYMVSSHGRIFNLTKNRWMTLSPTENGDLTVGLNTNGTQHRRSVKVLVAKLFVQGEDSIFDTPIQLDGDKENLRADNIVWRPRWFAWKYAQQFNHIPPWAYSGPLVEINSGLEFDTMVDAAIGLGELILDIRWNLLNKKPVFPHGSMFVYK